MSLTERLLLQSKAPNNDGCWIWAGLTHHTGYGLVKVQGRRILAHRASWLAFRGEIPDGLWVLHKCDVPACINPHHLFLGDHTANMADAASKGRIKGGRSKLTKAQVARILDRNMTAVTVARELGMSVKYIRRIRAGDRHPRTID